MNITYGVAFIAGLASFFSPCTLPLVPAYISYLGGKTAASNGQNNQFSRQTPLIHGVAFIIGFSIVFILLGGTISIIGWILHDLQYWITKGGGIIVIIFGLHLSGLYRIKFLDYDFRRNDLKVRGRSILTSVMMGMIFSAGWSPCIGPVLGSILTIALTEGSLQNGMVLLSVYSLGMAVPFLLTSLGVGWMIGITAQIKKGLQYVETISGWVLITIGILLFFDIFSRLSYIGGAI